MKERGDKDDPETFFSLNNWENALSIYKTGADFRG